MHRYLYPITIFALVSSGLWVVTLLFVPPVNGLVVTFFLLLGGLALASVTSLGIYYLRRLWGPKDSPRVILRTSLRQGFFLSLAALGFLLLQLFGATNIVSVALVLGLILILERLT